MGKISFLVLIPLLVLALVPVWASTWYVDDSVSASGDGRAGATAFKKIQEGVDAASHGDTVIVAEGTYVENILFKGSNIVLTSTDPLDPTVVAGTIIDGNQAGSVVTFSGTEAEACVLSGFTMRNGDANKGGGICGGTHADRTHATIQNNTITDNSAGGYKGYGGGLYYCGGTIENNTITGNSATYDGGGLYWCDGTIQSNTITGNSAGDGGGLYECDGTIQNNTITGNSAWGGGLYGCSGTIQNNTIAGNSESGLCGCDGTIQNNTITGNSAVRFGGGLFQCHGTIQNNTIAGNSAAGYGGGLAWCGGAIRNCIIWGNTAPTGPQLHESNIPKFSCVEGWSGGGQGNIASEPRFVNPEAHDYHLQGGSPCIDAGANLYWFTWPQQDADGNCRLVGLAVDMGCYEYGSSTDPDGDLLSDSDESAAGTDPLRDDSDADGLRDGLELLRGSDPLQVTPPRILNVPSEIATIQKSLCVSVAGDEVIVAPGTYRENLQFCGPDVILRSSDPEDPNVVGSTLVDGGGAGPVVSFVGGESEACVLGGFTIRNGSAQHGGGIRGSGTLARIQNNTITGNLAQMYGGGLYYCGGTVQNNTITDNSAGGYKGYGGGLCYCSGTIQDNTITGNSATEDGGGLYCCDSTIEKNTITGNSAKCWGGGLCDCDGTIHNNTLTGNSATINGGALSDCDGTIHNNTIAGNSANGYGGGGLSDCDGTIQNNTITGNSAAKYGGGLVWCDGRIQNNTITGNSAGVEGGGLCQCYGAIRNCIIWGNTSPSGPQLDDRSSIPTYSCIEDWSGGGEGNTASEPRFVDPDGPDNNPETWEDNDYRLLRDSPCIDAGKNEDWMSGSVDLDGNPRIMNGTVDIGAFEYLPNALVVLTLYAHERSATGPVLAGVRVTGRVGDGITFDKTTDSAGYVDITGAPGAWDFTASKEGYKTVSWSQGIATTCTRHAFLLETAPSLVITSPLEVTARELYRVGDVLNAGFTITNRGTDSVVLDTLVVGGRGPTGEIVDFEKAQAVTLNPGDSYTYHGSLTLPGQPGTYHFFCAYHTQEHMAGEDEYNWNTNIAVEIDGRLIEEFDEARGYREKDISVFKETYIGPAPPPAIWEKVSGPWDGESTSLAQIAVQPDDPDIVYAAVRHDHFYWGYEGDELYESTNGGADWRPINEGLPRLLWGYYYPIGAIAIAESDPNIIYIGTSSTDPYSGGLSSGKGIYKLTKSASGSPEWKAVGGPSCGWSIFKRFYCVSSMIVDPTNPDRAYAGTIAGGLWKTTDGGETWQKAWEEPINKETLLDVNAICVSSADPNVIYAAAYNFAPSEAKDWSRILIPNRLIESKNCGDSWENLRWGISTAAPKIDDIAVGKGNTEVAYVMTSVGYNSRAYKFIDHARTGVDASGTGGADALPAVDPVMQAIGFYGERGETGSICLHSDRADVIYAASTWGFDGVYFSPNSGENWFPMGLRGNHIRKLLFASGGGRHILYAAAKERLFKIDLSAGVVVAQIDSPGELRVYDAQGRITGLVDGEVKEEIPHSAYLDDAVVILSSSDSFSYEVGGKSAERYGLTLASTNELETSTFSASNIPTSADAIHRYSIDWSALSKGEEGVTLQMDSDGDGTFEETITAGTELRCLEQERLRLSLDGRTAAVTLEGLPSRQYTMEYTDDLANGTWQTVPGEWPIPGPVVWTENIVGVEKRYYRAILH